MSRSEAYVAFGVNGVPDLQFQFLPSFAGWLLDHKLESFVRTIIKISQKEDLSVLRLFINYSDDQLVELGIVTNGQLLTNLRDNRAKQHIIDSVNDWINNQLPLIDRNAIVAEDIAMISFVRREAFRIYLEEYTKDVKHFRSIMREIDRFTAASDIAGFNAYIHINQERLRDLNSKLELKSKELLDAQELAKMGSFYWDMEGKGRSEYTPMVFRIFEMERSADLDSFIRDVHPEDRHLVRSAIEQAINGNGIYECEYRYQRNNHLKRIWSNGKIEYRDGKAVGMRGTIMDITSQSELVEKLRESEKLHNQAQALTHIGNWTWNVINNQVTWSDEMYRIYGLQPQSEIITFDRFMSLVHPEDRASRMEQIQRSLESGETEDYLLRIITPAGEHRILKGKGELIKDQEGKPVMLAGTCQDISLEQKMNQALRDKEKYLSLLINRAPDAIIVIDAQSKIQLWNPKMESIFGWKEEEVLGTPLIETIIPPSHRMLHQDGMKRYLQTGEGLVINRTTEVPAITKDKRELFVSLTISELVQEGNRSFIAFVRDVTQDKLTRIELQNKTRQLEQRNQELKNTNEELESFNYAASHDLQEPLRKIRIFSSRVMEEVQHLPPRVNYYLGKINNSASRMQNLIEDLLEFSQKTAPEGLEQDVQLSELVNEAINSLGEMLLEAKASIEVGKLPRVKVVPFQFRQVFLNLLSNAIKFKKTDVPPVIKIASDYITGSLPNNGLQLQSENYFRITISDNGIGFNPIFSSRLFDLFARLHDKEKYSGTGIGLAICKKIVQNHKGFIRGESDGLNGAKFHIHLPIWRLIPEQDDCIVGK